MAGERLPGATPGFFSSQVVTARRFYLDLAPPPTMPLAVVCGGCEESRPDYAIHRQTFPYYSLEFVARGQGTLALNGISHPLLPGSIFTYGPQVTQDITSDPHDLLVKYFVDFTGVEAPALLDQAGLAPGHATQVVALGEVEAAFDLLIHDGCQGTGFAADLCRSMLEYLLLKIVASRVPGSSVRTPALATYQRCRQFIIDHCEQLMSLDEISRACHVDRAYLCRLFRRYDHQTPHQFLMRRKMHVAAQQLQSSDVLVKQVSARLGFSDPFHFSRSFKRVFGISPDSFRQHQR